MNLVAQHFLRIFHDRSHHAAGSAPGGPEVDEAVALMVCDFCIKLFIAVDFGNHRFLSFKNYIFNLFDIFIIAQTVKWEKRQLCGPGSEGSARQRRAGSEGSKGGGGALGVQILKKKDTSAAAGYVEWLCSLCSREKVLEMNRPDGRMVLTWESSSLFPQHIFYFVLWIERKWGNIVL
jgi:hypothetical protein